MAHPEVKKTHHRWQRGALSARCGVNVRERLRTDVQLVTCRRCRDYYARSLVRIAERLLVA